ncbi:hypothetical protein QWY84_16780 [Aquisalimonas lutea]|uniref:hypothetical protein n=1 Tax=Aquisalimonas lutea TaxID=1327750 RepID=UPI0025B5BAB6|nr:hypothetical protein [Aquisalimonas lutea]MDN3519272.1 hypothetical protein [Aquisalimonas lutea]
MRYTKDTTGDHELHRFEFLGSHGVEPLEIAGPLELKHLLCIAWHLADALGLGQPPELAEVSQARS